MKGLVLQCKAPCATLSPCLAPPCLLSHGMPRQHMPAAPRLAPPHVPQGNAHEALWFGHGCLTTDPSRCIPEGSPYYTARQGHHILFLGPSLPAVTG